MEKSVKKEEAELHKKLSRNEMELVAFLVCGKAI